MAALALAFSLSPAPPLERLAGSPAGPDEPLILPRAGTGPVFPQPGAFAGDGGPATEALLHHPSAVAVHPDGGFVVADADNHRIRRVDAAGVIDTLAGDGRQCPAPTDPCGDGGPATRASLNTPHDVDVLDDGTVLIADTFDNRIRRVSPDGRIATVAGTGVLCPPGERDCGSGGPALEARLSWPAAVVALGPDDLLVADHHAPRVRRVRGGLIADVAGTGEPGFSGDGGPAHRARFDGIADVARLPGDRGLLVSDGGNCRLRRVTGDGTVVPFAGSGDPEDCRSLDPLPPDRVGDGGPATEAALNVPGYLAVARDGTVHVTDVHNNRVRRIAPDGTIATIAGTGGPPAHGGSGGPAIAARLAWPSGVALAPGGLLLTDSGNNRVRLVTFLRRGS